VVNRGGDADTTGALAGQLAGAFYGVTAIPERWLKKLNQSVSNTIHEQTMQLLALRPAGQKKLYSTFHAPPLPFKLITPKAAAS
jgi:hypothetical protein